jgi:hypothetical protein
MRTARLAAALLVLFAGLPQAQAAVSLADARQVLVKYRSQWIANPDRIRDARIGEIYDIPFIGAGVCVAIDRALASSGHSGLVPLSLVIARVEITPAPIPFQPPPKTYYEFRVTVAPLNARCAEAPMLPFPELRNVGGHMHR